MTTESHQDDLRLLRTNLEWVSRQLALAGEPFVGLAEATAIADQESADLAAISAVLADHVIMSVELDRSGFARSTGSKKRVETVTAGWSHYLVEVLNPTSAVGRLWSNLPDGLAFMTARESHAIVPALYDMLDNAPMIRGEGVMFEIVGDQVLTGARLQFVLVAIFTRDEGPATTYLAISAGDGFFGFHVGHQGASFELEARASIPVTLEVRDTNGASCTFRLTIKDGAGVAGVGFDSVTVTGALNLASLSSANRMTLNVVSLDSSNVVGGNIANQTFAWNDPKNFTLFSYGTLTLGNGVTNVADLFSVNYANFKDKYGVSAQADWFTISNDSVNGAIVLTAIPEPSTYGMSLAGLALALAAIRRRNKRKTDAAK